MTTTVIAFDRKSARSFDADGRMRVRDCILSTAEVNPYRGAEIPKRETLGLDTNEVYDLYRDPAELGHPDSLASFEGVPLMIRHIVQTADEPRKDYVGGSVHNVHFDGKHLRGDLLVWDGHAIDLIESGELADLSCGYRYVPVMQSGEADGQHFHGRMTAIRGNHVALVDTGRATNAHVADSAFVDPRSSNPTMNGEANMAFPEKGAPQGAQPGGAPQAAPAAPAAGVAPGAEPAGGGMAEVGQALKALAEQHGQILAAIQQLGQQMGAGAQAPAGMDMELESEPAAQIEGAERGEHEREREGAMDDEDESEEESEAEREGRGAMDEEEETHDPMAPNGETTQPRMSAVSEGRSAEQPGRKSLSGGNNNPSLGAMDAAIQKAVTRERARAKAAERARREVAHVLGGDIALDSAGDIYREALVVMGVPSASIKRGTEHAAWIAAQAAQAAAAGYNAGAHADMALDSDTTKAVRSDMAAKLAKIKVRS